jgi:hypothetical protein
MISGSLLGLAREQRSSGEPQPIRFGLPATRAQGAENAILRSSLDLMEVKI